MSNSPRKAFFDSEIIVLVVGLTFVFVFMAKAFNFVFRWVPKTVSLPFFAQFIFYLVFFAFDGKKA